MSSPASAATSLAKSANERAAAREAPGPVPDDARGWFAATCPDCGGMGMIEIDDDEGSMITKDDALIKKMAKAVRKRQMERTGAGRAFDETCPPTDGEFDNAAAALAVARKEILDDAKGDRTALIGALSEISELRMHDIPASSSMTEYDLAISIIRKARGIAKIALATQEQRND